MNKFIIFFILFFSVSIEAEILKDKENTTIQEVDLDVLILPAPVAAQKSLLKNRNKLNQQIEQLYLRRVLANEAKDLGLDKKELNAVQINAVVEKILFQLMLHELQKENKKDYDKFARQIYMVRKEEFKVDERIDAAHILITTKNHKPEQALVKASEIRNQLLKPGADFNEIALSVSEDKSVQQNRGELGAFFKNQMVEPFVEGALALKPGEISEPVKTQYGYHIIKLNQIIPKGYKSYDEVKAGIISDLKKKDWEIYREEYYSNLKKKNKMQFNETAIDAYVAKKLKELEAK